MGVKKYIKIEAVQAIQAQKENRSEIEAFVGASNVHDTLPNNYVIPGLLYYIIINNDPLPVHCDSWVTKDMQTDTIEVWQDLHFKEHFKDAYHGNI